MKAPNKSKQRQSEQRNSHSQTDSERLTYKYSRKCLIFKIQSILSRLRLFLLSKLSYLKQRSSRELLVTLFGLQSSGVSLKRGNGGKAGDWSVRSFINC